jgi:TolA-binding protein
MEQQAKWFRGKTSEHSIVQAQANTAAAGGQFQKSRELRNRAFDLARRAGLNETAASSLANQALLEAVAENFSAAREKAVRAVQTARTRNVVHPAALAMVLSGSTAPAQALMDEFTNRYPSDTALKNVSVPSVQAVKEMTSGNARTAAELLESASGYDLGTCRGCGFVLYLRGQAYLKAGAGQEAAAAFQKVLDHRGAFNGIQRPLSNLGLGRAQALLGNAAEARKSYDDFFALWKNADPDIPILKKARAEYAKLR